MCAAGESSRSLGCNLISLDHKVFWFISVPKAGTEQYKARMPRAGTKEVDGGGASTSSFQVRNSRDLAKALSTLGISHINLGRSLTAEFTYLQR